MIKTVLSLSTLENYSPFKSRNHRNNVSILFRCTFKLIFRSILKPSCRNLPLRLALKELHQNKKITVLLVDKGNAKIVMPTGIAKQK